MDCPNLCRISEGTCNYCCSHYTVSNNFYRAMRPENGQYVTGYLVRSKKDNRIEGILNKDVHFYELTWIDETSLEKVKSD